MSSLTSLGVNKNTTRFTPKPSRSRKARKVQKPPTPPILEVVVEENEEEEEEDIKYPIAISKKQHHYQHQHQLAPKKAACSYLRDPPTPPPIPQQQRRETENGRKIPMIVAEESLSPPESPPDNIDNEEFKFEVVEEEEAGDAGYINLNEIRKKIRGESRKNQRTEVNQRKRKKKRLENALRTLDDVDFDPSTNIDPESIMAEHTRDGKGIVSHAFKQIELVRRQRIEQSREERKRNKNVAYFRKADSPVIPIAQQQEQLRQQQEQQMQQQRREADELTETVNAPQVRLVNGEIVLDTDSLVRRPVQVNHEQMVNEMEVVEENDYTRKVNSATYSKRITSSRWSELETKDFYDAIAQFGTDFEMISQIMPGRTRQQIKRKFNKEERDNSQKITEYMIKKRKPLDLEKYSALTGNELEEVPNSFMEYE